MSPIFRAVGSFRGRRSGGHHDGRPVKDCFRCGSGHDPRQCGFRDKNCFCCGRKGHAKVRCHQVGRKSKVKNIGEDDSDDEVHTVMCSVRGREERFSVVRTGSSK